MTVKHTLVSLDMRVFALCSLMELHRAETPGGGIQMLHPFCTGAGSRHLRHGADDGAVLDCAGRDPDDHGGVRSHGNGSIHTASRDRVND